MYVQVSLKNILFCSMSIKHYVWKRQQKNCVQKDTFNKNRLEESSRNVCSAGKEALYLRKITIFDVWHYYSSNYEIMFIQLYWIVRTNYMQIYIFMGKNKKQHKHSRCLNMFKLKHNIKQLVYEHYQVKQSKNCD